MMTDEDSGAVVDNFMEEEKVQDNQQMNINIENEENFQV